MSEKWPNIASAHGSHLAGCLGDTAPSIVLGALASMRWLRDMPLSDCPFVACVPACDEEARVAKALASLAGTLQPDDGIVLVVNGSTDATATVAMAALDNMVQASCVLEIDWHEGMGSAPLARRVALDVAHRAAPDAALFSFDSDSVCEPSLRAVYVAALGEGYDLVCGAIAFEPSEAALLPAADPHAEAILREARATTREVAARLDPDPDNPWPHHGNIGGANFVIRGTAYTKVGGLPVPPSGEDRALLRLARAHGFRVRFSDHAVVLTSCRTDGRAPGGLAADLRETRLSADPLVDEMLEPAETLRRRHEARRAFLLADTQEERDAVLCGIGIGPLALAAVHAEETPGLMWLAAEDACPALARTRLRQSELERLMPGLRALLADVRADAEPRTGSPAGALRARPSSRARPRRR